MSEDNTYLRCSCKECGNHIEFPESSAGTVVACPHCGQWTELKPDEPQSPAAVSSITPAPGRNWLLPALLIGAAVVAIVAAGFFFLHGRAKIASAPHPTPVKTVATPTNPPPVIPPPVKSAIPEKRQKSLDDLKASAVQLEKAKVGSLVYAVGIITNASEFQRFGVQVELDLFGKNGNKLGVAKDYKDIIEPNKEWQFHALIPDPRTVSVKVSAIKED